MNNSSDILNPLSEIERKGKKYQNAALVLMAVALISVAVLVWILINYSCKINFGQTGQLGDTIGGITAPVIGLLSAGLIYLSFLIQHEANRLQWKAFMTESRMKYISDLSKEIDNFSKNLSFKTEIKTLNTLLSDTYEQDKILELIEKGEIQRIILKLNLFFDKNILLFKLIHPIPSDIDTDIRNGFILEGITKSMDFFQEISILKTVLNKIINDTHYNKLSIFSLLHRRITIYHLLIEHSKNKLELTNIWDDFLKDTGESKYVQ